MRVTDLKTNRMVNPLGFDLGRPRLSYLVVDTAAKKQEAAQIQVALDVKFQETVYDSGKARTLTASASNCRWSFSHGHATFGALRSGRRAARQQPASLPGLRLPKWTNPGLASGLFQVMRTASTRF